MTTKPFNPSIEQVAYVLAEAAYQQMQTRVIADAKAELDFDAMTDEQYADGYDQIEQRHGYDKAWSDFGNARRALIAWAKARIETDPLCAGLLAANREDVEFMFANWQKYPKIAKQFIQLCLNLENKPIPPSYTAYQPNYPPYAEQQPA